MSLHMLLTNRTDWIVVAPLPSLAEAILHRVFRTLARHTLTLMQEREGLGGPQLCVAGSLISSNCSRSGKVKSLLLGSVSSRTANFLSLVFTSSAETSRCMKVQKSTASDLHWESPCFPAFVTTLCQDFITIWPFPFFFLHTSFFLEQSTRWLWLSSTSLLTKAPYVRPKVGWIYVR